MSAADNAGKRRGPSLIILLPLVVFGLLAGLFLAQLLIGRDPSELPSVLIGKAVPDLELPALDGVDLPGIAKADLKGKVSVVNVWASWCGPCRLEHPILMELAEDKRFAMIGINYKDQSENARRFLGSLGNPYSAIGVDNNGRAAIELGVYGVPETFVIGADGTIRHKFIGPLSEQAMSDTLMPAIEKALQASGS